MLICSDLGGALGKAALGFGLAGIDTIHPNPMNMAIMATIVAVGMAPPLGLALAAALRRSRHSIAEREHARTAWLIGAAFVPEGAIPYVVADPLRALPASLLGGAVTGTLTMVSGATTAYPYDGVFTADQLGKPLLFALSVAAGVLTTAGAAVALKSLSRRHLSATPPPAKPALRNRRTNPRVAAGR